MNFLRKNNQVEGMLKPNDVDASLLAEMAAAHAILRDDHDEQQQADRRLAEAEALRAPVAGIVEAAQARLDAAQQEANRLIADARRGLNDAQLAARTADAEAGKLEAAARSYAVAAKLAGLAVEARQQAEKLAQERRERLAEAEALQGRLDDLSARREAAQAALEAARAATDPEAAGEALQASQGIDAVTPVLEAQRAAAMARATAIGDETGAGEFAAALAASARFATERETALDHANPLRIEARYTVNPGLRIMEAVSAHPDLLAEWANRAADEAAKAQPKAIHRHADGHITGQNIRGAR